jgi:hypothetical protein
VPAASRLPRDDALGETRARIRARQATGDRLRRVRAVADWRLRMRLLWHCVPLIHRMRGHFTGSPSSLSSRVRACFFLFVIPSPRAARARDLGASMHRRFLAFGSE